jgi:hypothetical protein
MGHFAKIDKNNVVKEVIVAEWDFLDSASGLLKKGEKWVRTSYNMYGGVHKEGGFPLRKNFAGIGFSYDAEKDAFIPPKPDDGEYTLNLDTCLWEPEL